MILTPKKELAIKIFCIIIITFLCIVIYINDKYTNCDNCKIHFTSTKQDYSTAFNKPYQDFYVNISILYESYLNKSCTVTWNKKDGYKYDYNKVEQNN